MICVVILPLAAAGVHSHPMLRTRHVLLKLLLAGLVAGALLLAYLDARITSTFTEKMWNCRPRYTPGRWSSLPAAAGCGGPTSLEVLGYRKVTHTSGPGRWRAIATDSRSTPAASTSRESEPAQGAGGTGRRLGAADHGRWRAGGFDAPGPGADRWDLPSHGEDRVLVQLDDVPPTLRDGLLAVEDLPLLYPRRYFPGRYGAGGLQQPALSGQVVAGGSTITQQLVKNYYLPRAHLCAQGYRGADGDVAGAALQQGSDPGKLYQ